MISSYPFIQQFEIPLQEEIEKEGKVIEVKAGEVIIDIGHNIRFMPIVLTGAMKVLREEANGHELLLYYLNAEESCAMTFTCCMQTKLSEIKAVAEEDSSILAIPINLLEKWMNNYPSWKRFVMQSIQSRFDELLRTIDQIAFQKLDDRLIHYLKEKERITSSAVINLSHEQIAQELATSRVVISRLLKKLENEKKVVLYRNQIKILSGL